MTTKTKTALASLPLLIVAACSGASPTDFESPNLHVSNVGGVRLITQNVIPTVTMDALFQGNLLLDEDGCVRLDAVDEATVVWPQGFTAGRTVEGVLVRDESGAPFGRLGDEVSLPGGEVAALHEGLGFTEADRTLATEHCPGGYWIVAW